MAETPVYTTVPDGSVTVHPQTGQVEIAVSADEVLAELPPEHYQLAYTKAVNRKLEAVVAAMAGHAGARLMVADEPEPEDPEDYAERLRVASEPSLRQALVDAGAEPPEVWSRRRLAVECAERGLEPVLCSQ